MPCWATFSTLMWQLWVSLIRGTLWSGFHIPSYHIRDRVGSENIYSEGVLSLFTFSVFCSCCHLRDCFLLRAVNQLMTACPLYLFWGWERLALLVWMEMGFIHDTWQLNCHLPLRWFPNYNLFCAGSGNRRIEKQNLFAAKQIGSGQPGSQGKSDWK